jgi:hypothetical protein
VGSFTIVRGLHCVVQQNLVGMFLVTAPVGALVAGVHVPASMVTTAATRFAPMSAVHDELVTTVPSAADGQPFDPSSRVVVHDAPSTAPQLHDVSHDKVSVAPVAATSPST